MSERNICLWVEYDGTPYLGWQKQKDGPSVEAELLSALNAITSTKPKLVVAGRTDAGVHAIGQVVNFKTQSTIEESRFAHALNARLPDTITIHRSESVPLDFSARLDSTGKRYRYRVYQGPHLPALEVNRVWHHRTPLDLRSMQRAAESLIGEHDFESFRSVHCDAEHAVREMFSIQIARQDRLPAGFFIDIIFHANAYCRHMCRVLAGTLCDVGRGKISNQSIQPILHARDRRRAGVTAPSSGLTLLEVHYA